MTCRLWLVRHGNTFARGEVPRRVGSRTDLSLTDTGQAQGRILARYFADRGVTFGSAYAGPLRRTQETARIILADSVCPLQEMSILQEIDHGPDEGQTEQLVRDRIGERALARWDRNAGAPPGWIVNAPDRLSGWRRFFETLAHGGDEDCLCVSSTGALRFALMALHQDGRLTLPPSLKIRTGAFALIEISGGRFDLNQWDAVPDREFRAFGQLVDGTPSGQQSGQPIDR